MCTVILSCGKWQPTVTKKNILSFVQDFGVRNGRPATRLDAANYANGEWDKVTDESIKNELSKAGLRISLDNAVQRPLTIMHF